MNAFFTEEEKQSIFKQSCWMDLISDAAHCVPDYADFSRQLDLICDLGNKPLSEDAQFLFGTSYEPSAGNVCFYIFVMCMMNSVTAPTDRHMLVQNAFGDWPDAFCQAMRDLFAFVMPQCMEKIVGSMTTPTSVWAQEKALPVIKDGSYIRKLAFEWPICFRQLVGFTQLQTLHVQEIIDAVCHELPNKWPALEGNRPCPQVKHVGASASDRHNGGRCVHILSLSDGGKLVYKPHDMQIDRAFGKWLCFVAERAELREFKTVRSVDTAKGGFCTFVSPTPLESPAQAREFFERMGFLLGVVYMLRGSDLHAENIIACGTDPVVVDMETMITPPGCLIRRLTGDAISYSISNMAVLPLMLSLPGLREARYAALCDVWPGAHNLPVWQGKPLSGADYPDEISRGFELALNTISADVEGAANKLIELFNGCRIRLVLRPTMAYVKVLVGLANRAAQCDKNKYARLVQHFSCFGNCLSVEEQARLSCVEYAALDRLDVPFFSENMNAAMLKGLADEWRALPHDKAETESQCMKFGLSRVRPDNGCDAVCKITPDERCSDTEFRANMRALARRVAKLLGTEARPLAVSKNQDAYILAFGLMGERCLLDGNFGAIMSLCAYMTAFPDDDEIGIMLRREMSVLTDGARTAPALTSSELGLADGTAGFLRGCCMCRDMGWLSDDDLRRVIANVSALSKEEARLRLNHEDAMYGSAGLVYAIAHVPPEFCTSELEKLNCILRDMMSKSSKYAQLLTSSALEEYVRGEMLLAHGTLKAGVSANDTLRFGNAGLLYECTYRKQTAPDSVSPDENALMRALAFELSKAEHVLRNVQFPQDYMETGLFHGLPGVLYSVSRFINPEKVPAM